MPEIVTPSRNVVHAYVLADILGGDDNALVYAREILAVDDKQTHDIPYMVELGLMTSPAHFGIPVNQPLVTVADILARLGVENS
jgi:hypothetical protein